MCGIAGILNLKNSPIQNLDCSLRIMNKLQKHRGQREGSWTHREKYLGLSM